MKYSTVTSPSFASDDQTSIACIVQFEGFPAPIAFVASAGDPEPHGAALFAALSVGDFGRVAPYVAPVPTQAALTAAVQRHLDAAAQALGYDDIATAVTYADEPAVPTFQAQGRAFRAWRSLVWAACIVTLNAVKAGRQTVPAAAALIASLPAFVAP